MPSIASTFRALGGALGNERAVANAAASLRARRREDWLVTVLARRLEAQDVTQPQTVRADSGVSSHAAA